MPTTQIDTNSSDDDLNSPNHLLYLHQNDHPGLILISKKLTGSDNFSSWRRSMMIALNAKNKLQIVTGQFVEPETSSRTRALWERTNDMIISWILKTISYEISNSLSFANTAKDLWKELQEHYSQLDGHRVYQLTNDITQLKQNQCTTEVYYHKLKGFWDEIYAIEAPYVCTCTCTCENGKTNVERDQRKRLMQFLMGLDECYSNIRGQILLMQPLPSVAKTYGMIRQEERQREAASTSKPITSAALSANSYYNRNSNNSSSKWSNNRFTMNTGNQPKNSTFKKGIYCRNCGFEGHTKDECYKLVGYPVGYPLHGKFNPSSNKTSSQYTPAKVNMMTTTTDSNNMDLAMNAMMD
ncbi:uncharacterized protein [Rutidosis leptorrhynchoides]|uniref:uncharacterized protein n=1 Tax=Rutidosis leptorrhynchoides TaxID=125765 RepID=UPI003A9A64D8